MNNESVELPTWLIACRPRMEEKLVVFVKRVKALTYDQARMQLARDNVCMFAGCIRP